MRCQLCGNPLELPVILGAPRRGDDGSMTIDVRLNQDGAQLAIEAHALADPDHHDDLFTDVADDTASPDTSRAYFLDLLGRIDDVTS